MSIDNAKKLLENMRGATENPYKIMVIDMIYRELKEVKEVAQLYPTWWDQHCTKMKYDGTFTGSRPQTQNIPRNLALEEMTYNLMVVTSERDELQKQNAKLKEQLLEKMSRTKLNRLVFCCIDEQILTRGYDSQLYMVGGRISWEEARTMLKPVMVEILADRTFHAIQLLAQKFYVSRSMAADAIKRFTK